MGFLFFGGRSRRGKVTYFLGKKEILIYDCRPSNHDRRFVRCLDSHDCGLVGGVIGSSLEEDG